MLYYLNCAINEIQDQLVLTVSHDRDRDRNMCTKKTINVSCYTRIHYLHPFTMPDTMRARTYVTPISTAIQITLRSPRWLSSRLTCH